MEEVTTLDQVSAHVACFPACIAHFPFCNQLQPRLSKAGEVMLSQPVGMASGGALGSGLQSAIELKASERSAVYQEGSSAMASFKSPLPEEIWPVPKHWALLGTPSNAVLGLFL